MFPASQKKSGSRKDTAAQLPDGEWTSAATDSAFLSAKRARRDAALASLAGLRDKEAAEQLLFTLALVSERRAALAALTAEAVRFSQALERSARAGLFPSGPLLDGPVAAGAAGRGQAVAAMGIGDWLRTTAWAVAGAASEIASAALAATRRVDEASAVFCVAVLLLLGWACTLGDE